MSVQPRPLTEKYPAFAQTSQNPQTTNDWDDLVSGKIKEQQERIRMQEPEDPTLNRRDALIRAGAGAVLGVLVAKGTNETYKLLPEDQTAPEATITSASLEVEIMKRKTKGKKNNYNTIMRKFASAKIGRKDKRSRFEYAQQQIAASKLPPMVKAILPYLPMQESSYRLCETSKDAAKGPWQFIPETAKKYGLKDDAYDRRCNFKASTDAAIKYFADIVKKLKASKHFKALESQFSTQDMEDFLSLITINAFNSGEGHMLKAMELLATEKDIKKEMIAADHNGGGQGLYVYLTKVYNAKSTSGLHGGKYGKKYQKGIRPKYANVSSRYVYDILAYKWIHEGKKSNHKEAQDIKPFEDAPSKPRKISAMTASISAGVATILGYLGVKRAQEGKEFFGDVMTTRRELLGLGVATGAAAIAGAAENKLDIAKKVASIELSCDGKEKKGAKRFNEKDIKEHVDVIRISCYCPGVSDAEIIKPSRYDLAQKLADNAYSHFKQTSDVKFMQIAKYYYNYCLYLIDEQLKGKMLLPRVGGREKVLKRRKYIKQALKIVNG